MSTERILVRAVRNQDLLNAINGGNADARIRGRGQGNERDLMNEEALVRELVEEGMDAGEAVLAMEEFMRHNDEDRALINQEMVIRRLARQVFFKVSKADLNSIFRMRPALLMPRVLEVYALFYKKTTCWIKNLKT